MSPVIVEVFKPEGRGLLWKLVHVAGACSCLFTLFSCMSLDRFMSIVFVKVLKYVADLGRN